MLHRAHEKKKKPNTVFKTLNTLKPNEYIDKALVEEEVRKTTAVPGYVSDVFLGFLDNDMIINEKYIEPLYTRKQLRKLGRRVLKDQLEQPRNTHQRRYRRRRVGMPAATMEQKFYATSQSEPYPSVEVVDGKIKKNVYGNVEVYHPDMVPSELVHVNEKYFQKHQIPFTTCSQKVKSLQKVCHNLGLEHSPVIAGFQRADVGWTSFSGSMAGHVKNQPVKDGLVVLKSDLQLALDACAELETHEQHQQQEVHHQLVVKRWEKLTRFLVIRSRVSQRHEAEQLAHTVKTEATAQVKQTILKGLSDQSCVHEFTSLGEAEEGSEWVRQRCKTCGVQRQVSTL